MRPGDILMIQEIEEKLSIFSKSVKSLPGVRSGANRSCLARQIVDSIRRIKYFSTIRDKVIDESIINPSVSSFNPIKAAIWHENNGNFDEAFWLIFLATHFGKNKKTGWGLLRNVYGQLNSGNSWTWKRMINDLGEFKRWLDENLDSIHETGKFSNHRKYESLGMSGTVITSYIEWVGENFDHRQKIESVSEDGDNPGSLFDSLYRSMSSVFRFGRTAKFDYLCMIGKIGLADIEPGFTYMSGATGPIFGARLLFKNSNLTPTEAETLLSDLNDHLDLYFGMQVLEDALCNWQKSPSAYEHFKG